MNGMLIAMLAVSMRFRMAANGSARANSNLTYLVLAPASIRLNTNDMYLGASPVVTPRELSAASTILPLPEIAIPEVESPRLNWADEARRAGEAELARDQSPQRSFPALGSESLPNIVTSTSRGMAPWDAAKPKGLELDDYETRLWVSEHCYLFVGQPAPQQNLGAKCRLGRTTAPTDLFEDWRARP